jgi:hypothetical protein
MLWALTKPVLDACTDLGDIDPEIVLRRVNLVSSVVALADVVKSGASIESTNRKLTLFSFIESEFTYEI